MFGVELVVGGYVWVVGVIFVDEYFCVFIGLDVFECVVYGGMGFVVDYFWVGYVFVVFGVVGN